MAEQTQQPTLASKLDSLDELDASLHQFYTEKDGKYALNVEGYEDPAAAQKFVKERKAKTTLEKQLNDLKQSLGVDETDQIAVKFQELKTQLDELQNAQKEPPTDDKDSDVNKVKQQMLAQHTQQLDKVKNQLQEQLNNKDLEIARLRRSLDQQLIRGELDAALDKLGATAEGKMLLREYLASSCQVVEVGDGYVAQVIGSDGTPEVNAQGDNLTIAELVTRSKDQFKSAFAAPDNSGSSAKSGGKVPRSNKYVVTDETNLDDYRRLKENAAKQGTTLTFAKQKKAA